MWEGQREQKSKKQLQLVTYVFTLAKERLITCQQLAFSWSQVFTRGASNSSCFPLLLQEFRDNYGQRFKGGRLVPGWKWHVKMRTPRRESSEYHHLWEMLL